MQGVVYFVQKNNDLQKGDRVSWHYDKIYEKGYIVLDKKIAL